LLVLNCDNLWNVHESLRPGLNVQFAYESLLEHIAHLGYVVDYPSLLSSTTEEGNSSSSSSSSSSSILLPTSTMFPMHFNC